MPFWHGGTHARNQERERPIEAPLAELHERQPEGSPTTSPGSDGVSFIHIVTEHDIAHPDSLQHLPAFQAFLADIGDRCDVPPVATAATVVGSSADRARALRRTGIFSPADRAVIYVRRDVVPARAFGEAIRRASDVECCRRPSRTNLATRRAGLEVVRAHARVSTHLNGTG